jgi:hypothetical protein
VAGLVLIDPVAFRTFRFYVRHYGPRLFRLESWRNAITGRNRTLRKLTERMVKLRERRKQETPDFELSGVVRGPTKRETTDRFNALLARGGRLLLIHTGGLDTQFNYRGQFKDGFPEIYSDSGTTFEYLPNTDHTFSTEKQRAALLGLVCDWLKQRDWSL